MTDPLGTHETHGTRHVLRYERRLAHPVERVWAALTDPDELRGWLAEAERLELVEGGTVVLRWLNSDQDGNQAVLHGVVTELEPGRVLEVAGEPHGTLRWELRPDGDGCELTFSSTLPPEAGESIHLALPGWHVHLEHLAALLDGTPVHWSSWDADHLPRWQELHDAYERAAAP
jgi:uncharacterized protein YndB with AHSA1/START domain